jgi:putative endonuclease
MTVRASRQSIDGDSTVNFWVYIAGSHSGPLHVGVAGDPERRLARVRRLLYAERTPDVFAAIARAKQIKGWSRSRRIQLIAQSNPSWRDLAPSSLRRVAAQRPGRRPFRQA